MKWLKSFKSDSGAAGLPLIRHGQLLFAFQQYSAETYNKGMSAAMPLPGADIAPAMSRPEVEIIATQGVEQYLLPAIEEKIKIIELMEDAHQQARELGVGTLQKPYELFSVMIEAVSGRAEAQQDGFLEWLADQSVETGTSRFDLLESAAIDDAATALNQLIAKAKLSPDSWLAINGEAFNEVRAVAGLPPYSPAEFQDRYLRLLNGDQVWFFNIESNA